MNLNDPFLRLVIRQLTEARQKPPTIFSMLLQWRGLPLLALIGIVVVSILASLDLPTSVPMFMGGVILGAALRDFGIARKAVRAWAIQRELFDWPKIDALAKQIDGV